MNAPRLRPAFSLLELLLFLGMLGMSAGVVIALLLSTNENRIRQQSISTVEHTGVQLTQALTRSIRAAERVTFPAMGFTGSALALQMAVASEDPTIISLQSGAIVVARRDTLRTLSSTQVTILDLEVSNTSSAAEHPSVLLHFTVQHVVPVIAQGEYRRTFEVLVTPFPDDAPQGNSCGCPAPSCTDGFLTWSVCGEESCQPSGVRVPC